jgi:hypothetical protein
MVEVPARPGPAAAGEFPWRRSIRPRHVLSAALFLLAVTVTALCVALPLERNRSPSDWIVHGVALGMTEREVQTYFIDGPHGTWSATIGCSGPGLQWFRNNPLATARYARFEFRNGALVAMRVRGAHEPHGPPAEATATAVRAQHENLAGSEIALIDRGCVEHRAEADLIALAARRSQ